MGIAVGLFLVFVAAWLFAALFTLTPLSAFVVFATALAVLVAFVGICFSTSTLFPLPGNSRIVVLTVFQLTFSGEVVVPKLAGLLIDCI